MPEGTRVPRGRRIRFDRIVRLPILEVEVLKGQPRPFRSDMAGISFILT